MDITAAQLRALAPNAAPFIVDGIVADRHFLAEAGIVTPIRIRHFFARVCVETGGLRAIEENLNYSAARLCQVWPTRFRSIAAASPYAHNPQALANKVYGGRLGNTRPNDGWDYRGSGILQNTGRANFAEVEAETGLPVVANPDLLRSFPGAIRAAAVYWSKRNINALADAGNVLGVCKAVNGGTTGLADQRTWLAKAEKVWPDAADGRPTIRRGARGDDVRALQAALGEVADGIFGPATEAAVKAFQASHGLAPDGVVGPKTWAAIAA
jgi:putative chitinase